jgi:hypothetical protein
VPFDQPLSVKATCDLLESRKDNPKLPSAQEYLVELQSFNQFLGWRVLVIPFALWFAMLLALAYFGNAYLPPPREVRRQVSLWIIGVISVASVGFAAGTWLLWKRPASLSCPHCQRSLIGNRPIVVASRHCPGCGGRVLRDPESFA